jgi:hypothetical protein
MLDSKTTVLFVKKTLPDGQPCAKCRDIEGRLHKDGLMYLVDDVVPAREDDPSSPGIRLAERHGVERAPFFVIRRGDGDEQVIDSYLAFKRWFSDKGSTPDDLTDAVDKHPDLAFI